LCALSAQQTSDMRKSEGASQTSKRFLDTNTCFWPLAFLRRREGASWHNVYFLVFHIFSVLANLNTRAQLGSDTLGLQAELYNFHAICK
jgi:hypothetical protein